MTTELKVLKQNCAKAWRAALKNQTAADQLLTNFKGEWHPLAQAWNDAAAAECAYREKHNLTGSNYR